MALHSHYHSLPSSFRTAVFRCLVASKSAFLKLQVVSKLLFLFFEKKQPAVDRVGLRNTSQLPTAQPTRHTTWSLGRALTVVVLIRCDFPLLESLKTFSLLLFVELSLLARLISTRSWREQRGRLKKNEEHEEHTIKGMFDLSCAVRRKGIWHSFCCVFVCFVVARVRSDCEKDCWEAVWRPQCSKFLSLPSPSFSLSLSSLNLRRSGNEAVSQIPHTTVSTLSCRTPGQHSPCCKSGLLRHLVLSPSVCACV